MDDHLKQGWVYGSLVVLALLAGCGSTDFGGEIRVPASQQHALTAEQPAAGTIHLPADRSFNIHIKKSTRNPGPDGTASSDSNATADGYASCSAQATHGGSASAEFNIGHRITNRTDTARSVTARLTYQLSQAIEASAEPTAKTLGTAHLQLVALDSRRRSVAQVLVVQATSDEANATAANRDERTVTFQMEPGEAYDIMLFGRADVTADTDQQASARIDLRELKMELDLTPAATQPAAP